MYNQSLEATDFAFMMDRRLKEEIKINYGHRRHRSGKLISSINIIINPSQLTAMIQAQSHSCTVVVKRGSTVNSICPCNTKTHTVQCKTKC
jgi:hypothetical protein